MLCVRAAESSYPSPCRCWSLRCGLLSWSETTHSVCWHLLPWPELKGVNKHCVSKAAEGKKWGKTAFRQKLWLCWWTVIRCTHKWDMRRRCLAGQPRGKRASWASMSAAHVSLWPRHLWEQVGVVWGQQRGSERKPETQGAELHTAMTSAAPTQAKQRRVNTFQSVLRFSHFCTAYDTWGQLFSCLSCPGNTPTCSFRAKPLDLHIWSMEPDYHSCIPHGVTLTVCHVTPDALMGLITRVDWRSETLHLHSSLCSINIWAGSLVFTRWLSDGQTIRWPLFFQRGRKEQGLCGRWSLTYWFPSEQCLLNFNKSRTSTRRHKPPILRFCPKVPHLTQNLPWNVWNETYRVIYSHTGSFMDEIQDKFCPSLQGTPWTPLQRLL